MAQIPKNGKYVSKMIQNTKYEIEKEHIFF